MKVAVVVVSFNTRKLLRQALASVYASARASDLSGGDFTIVVVDNDSADGSAEMVSQEYPGARLIKLGENAGFTRANNLALATLGFPISARELASERALGDFMSGTDRLSAAKLDSSGAQELPDTVLLLNPDAELLDDALGRLLRFMDDYPHAGACGPRLEYADGSFQHGAFRFPSPAQVVLDLYPVYRLPHASRLYDGPANGRYPKEYWEGPTPFPVDFVLGAALLIRGDALLRIGGLDEGYFMYCEEMDWCLRLRRAGLGTFAVPDARVRHHEAQSSRQAPWPAFRNLWRSRIRFYKKHRKYFAPGLLLAVRCLLRMALRRRIRETRRRFARGEITGMEAAEALESYAYAARQ